MTGQLSCLAGIQELLVPGKIYIEFFHLLPSRRTCFGEKNETQY